MKRFILFILMFGFLSDIFTVMGDFPCRLPILGKHKFCQTRKPSECEISLKQGRFCEDVFVPKG